MSGTFGGALERRLLSIVGGTIRVGPPHRGPARRLDANVPGSVRRARGPRRSPRLAAAPKAHRHRRDRPRRRLRRGRIRHPRSVRVPGVGGVAPGTRVSLRGARLAARRRPDGMAATGVVVTATRSAAGHRPALRPRQRLLRGMARRDDDVQRGDLLPCPAVVGRGPAREVPSPGGGHRDRPRGPRARDRVRLGRVRHATGRRDRLPRHHDHRLEAAA